MDNLSPEIANIKSYTALALLLFSLGLGQLPYYRFVWAMSESLALWPTDLEWIHFETIHKSRQKSDYGFLKYISGTRECHFLKKLVMTMNICSSTQR